MTYALSIGFDILNLSFSPIKGPEGNIEYLLYIEKNDSEAAESEEAFENAKALFEENYRELAEETVEEAHGCLD